MWLVRSSALADLALSQLSKQQRKKAQEKFQLPPPERIDELLSITASPLDEAERLPPSRWLMLCCYEATHGPGCMLLKKAGKDLSDSKKAGACAGLFFRLTGCRELLPGIRHGEVTASELHAEAITLSRKSGSLGELPPEARANLKKWLLEKPDALRPREILGHNFIVLSGSINVALGKGKPRERPAPIGHAKAFGRSSQRNFHSTAAEQGALGFYAERSGTVIVRTEGF